MAKKSKTQRAKASARRAEKKERASLEVVPEETASSEDDKTGSKLFSRKEKTEGASSPRASSKSPARNDTKRPGVIARFRTFVSEVRSEMRRVTWPTRQDVIRWSGVVVVALVFFSLYVFVLDNWVVTPLLLAISSLGA